MNASPRSEGAAPGLVTRPADLADQELVALSLEGDGEAFGALVARYRPLVFSIITSRLSDVRDVEDEAQETFVLAFSRLRALREPSQFAPWIARIAANRAYSRIRRDARTPDLVDVPDDPTPDGAWGWQYQLPRLAAREAVRDAVGRLPDIQSDLLRMRFVDEATYPEIGATIGVLPRAAEKRVQRGLRHLRARLRVR
jgi:RNA polymerase sigma-70 factor (ECF subfamily)